MKISIQNRINIIQQTAQVINQVKGHVMFSWTWNSKVIYWYVPLALCTLVTIVHGTCQQEQNSKQLVDIIFFGSLLLKDEKGK